MQESQGFLIDHVFIAVSRGGSEVAPLIRSGFVEGPSNTHPGQGTACRRFFFSDGYLEFLWLEDESEASTPVISRTGLAARLAAGTTASRLGVCVRLPTGQGPPVETWEYRPPYLPAGPSILMGGNSFRLTDPLLFFLPASLTQRRVSDPHENGVRRLSRVTLTLPDLDRSSVELEWLAHQGLAEIERGEAEAIQVDFDDERQGTGLVLGTPSPLTLRW